MLVMGMALAAEDAPGVESRRLPPPQKLQETMQAMPALREGTPPRGRTGDGSVRSYKYCRPSELRVCRRPHATKRPRFTQKDPEPEIYVLPPLLRLLPLEDGSICGIFFFIFHTANNILPLLADFWPSQ